ncbi:branched-chain amino acid ABC transporter permease [Heyndrickxia sporothermodurans]|uniref:ABC transporter permease n=1 Tax=Heyndrickxia sporothermodurans TaxID=46224 RepID=A0AB37H8P5_9BACI|nr:ABC transporter permease [Heyndrickxia sporothermodurans]MBL5767729.1 ABC transporter permease [Heyndrickxia sporothermodurans]MBL5771235.1 ABC transporter permease [Heyndrickxia sporothermodurans]MBL5774926.1 ABC transporter permease [Heyndrickxia sporothermodurans]MBL5778401.1 ABC transporter permease [Heyndrickxia sporothermodurans]MBL5782231.1 ABC transporter permease [Heyndrickxia sporothermodurans]
MSNRLVNILIPVVSVILGLIAGAIIMLISGYNPINGYLSLWNGAFGDSFYIGETLRQVTPYIFAGLAVAFAFRTGLFNIGVEGQMLMGWIVSVWVGLAFDLPKIIHLPLAIIAAAIAGAIWGFIPGLLKAKFRVHEVIVTIMMNYIALHVSNYIIRNVLSDQSDTTKEIPNSASLKSDFFQSITDYSSLHNGIYLAIIAAIIMWFLLEKTTKGYELKSVGFNQHASQYAGMNVNKNIIYSMIISGVFAGLAGAMQGLGTFGFAFLQSSFSGVGFDGIAVALLGGNTALGVVIASILFGGLRVGSLNMPIEANVPNELVEIVIALIIFFVASSYMIKWIITRFKREVK